MNTISRIATATITAALFTLVSTGCEKKPADAPPAQTEAKAVDTKAPAEAAHAAKSDHPTDVEKKADAHHDEAGHKHGEEDHAHKEDAPKKSDHPKSDHPN